MVDALTYQILKGGLCNLTWMCAPCRDRVLVIAGYTPSFMQTHMGYDPDPGEPCSLRTCIQIDVLVPADWYRYRYNIASESESDSHVSMLI